MCTCTCMHAKAISKLGLNGKAINGLRSATASTHLCAMAKIWMDISRNDIILVYHLYAGQHLRSRIRTFPPLSCTPRAMLSIRTSFTNIRLLNPLTYKDTSFYCPARPHHTHPPLSIRLIIASPFTHSGTTSPTALQKSHLTPLPPSHEYASTTLNVFSAFGDRHCPPTGSGHVVLRSSWYGVAIV